MATIAKQKSCRNPWILGLRQISQKKMRLDDDPYGDCFWGILTGYDATNALRIAHCRDPLIIRRVAAGVPGVTA